jgi:predicted enzyme related to lactoylglutathione lyase
MDGVRGFNLPVDEMERAVRFYRLVFGWNIDHIPGSGGNFHGAQTTEVDEKGEPDLPGAINGGLYLRGTHGLNGTFLEIKVTSIDEAVEKVLSNGGEVVRPKAPLLDIAYFAIVRDTEGNALGLWQDILPPFDGAPHRGPSEHRMMARRGTVERPMSWAIHDYKDIAVGRTDRPAFITMASPT